MVAQLKSKPKPTQGSDEARQFLEALAPGENEKAPSKKYFTAASFDFWLGLMNPARM